MVTDAVRFALRLPSMFFYEIICQYENHLENPDLHMQLIIPTAIHREHKYPSQEEVLLICWGLSRNFNRSETTGDSNWTYFNLITVKNWVTYMEGTFWLFRFVVSAFHHTHESKSYFTVCSLPLFSHATGSVGWPVQHFWMACHEILTVMFTQRKNPTEFHDPLTFSLAPPAGWHVWF